MTPPNSHTESLLTDATRTAREQLPTPDAPPDSALEEVTPLPEAWQTMGNHHTANDHDMRLFAIGYDGDALPNAFRVRYIQPRTDYTQYQRFDVTEWRPHTYLPAIFTSDTESFPLSYGVPPQSKGFASPPTETERQLLWAVHGDYLKAHTNYLPPDVDTHPSVNATR